MRIFEKQKMNQQQNRIHTDGLEQPISHQNKKIYLKKNFEFFRKLVLQILTTTIAHLSLFVSLF
jgi:hypothetical protein